MLAGKRALVTGGSSGIGEAIVERFVAEGASVVLVARDAERGTAVAARHDGAATFLRADIADVASLPDVVERTLERLGAIDILVNNAGAFAVGPLIEPDEEVFARNFDVNVKGPYFLTGLVAPSMMRQGQGKIVSITTMAACVGVPGIGVYSASKAAVASLTQTWAAELGPHGINVNAVAPGPVATPMTAGIAAAQDEFARAMPARRRGEPGEIASAVLYLASDESNYMHGAHVMVDGGFVAV
ncbi:SDR family NAD(P)-dependent oxidoreductase [Conexibacter sp. CPCC 206217]|uniref:SDR family NAD(P)-dependent oxidoreductase n=1 Tax=Conexibacter sp. CPCC 206217 TaxID=3064574 RepID=UPI00271D88D8|nr:SDR family oxidoreductase [Conexibacter sp. CPCC 206217]MDO8210104.1 SDR family oxidoreductase [Conexibacter sp. CPCC 206217]